MIDEVNEREADDEVNGHEDRYEICRSNGWKHSWIKVDSPDDDEGYQCEHCWTCNWELDD